MRLSFTNRTRELAALRKARKTGGLVILYGRRRLGKSRLLRRWLKKEKGLYTQAIEAAPPVQLGQVFEDIRSGLETSLSPKSWEELFEIIDLQKGSVTLCIDEFPYLVESDRSLPSRIQRWIDQTPNTDLTLVLSGSSTRMMQEAILDEGSPLYGRAQRVLRLAPMGYCDFCDCLELSPGQESFEKFALVGGVPKYWEFVDPQCPATEVADTLYFDFAPYMENEPRRVLRDEKLPGVSPLSMLEVIGRGAHRPSEMAARLGTVQTNLSPVLQKLIAAEILVREIPFGTSERNSKRTLYKIKDPALRFWYQVCSPHRSLWGTYPKQKKARILSAHVGTVFEDFCRERHPGSRRYWEKSVEFDLVRPDAERDGSQRGVVVSEVKWKILSSRERTRILRSLQDRWKESSLSQRWEQVRFEVLDTRLVESR